MKKLLLLLPLVLVLSLATAQRNSYFEAGFLFGLTNYSGDVSDAAIEISETQPGYGVYFRYHFSRYISAKAHIYSGSIAGDDVNSRSLKERSFRFSTSILEFGTVVEWKVLGRERYSNTGIHNFFVTPYVFAGLGLSVTDPKAEYYGTIDNREKYLKTDLPEDGLNHNFLLVPMGVGLRADILDRLVLGLEGGWRPVFSDDLDGIRTNGNPGKGDWYYFAGVTVSFILSDPKRKH
ncbi:MAG: outer membrane beta-barrel protein [Lewinellaceae bacterium]|jgi:hypothetical protein|nr:outer membrane beta-barrel protein [Lewinellaceae bacterium]